MPISFSARALARLDAISAYIKRENPAAARAVLGEIRRACDLVESQPKMGRAITELDLRFHITRRYRYRIIYRISGASVQVLDILHPRQEWPGQT